MSPRREMVIGVIIVAMAVWTAAIFALQTMQGYPSLTELADEGVRARIVMWAVWLVGIAIGRCAHSRSEDLWPQRLASVTAPHRLYAAPSWAIHGHGRHRSRPSRRRSQKVFAMRTDGLTGHSATAASDRGGTRTGIRA